MSVRTSLAVVCVALPAMVAAILALENRQPAASMNATARSAVARVVPPRTMEVQPPTAVVDPLQPDEAATTAYAAMRDNGNPRPRLQLIDAWAREAPPAARLDLLSQAMVDPDESVRSRAQELFDRRIHRP